MNNIFVSVITNIFMSSIIIKNGTIINEGLRIQGDILIKNDKIEKIGGVIDDANAKEIDAENMIVMPGIIDDQVHFREPGLTHKADIATESMAAAFGGTTSFMEMPNVKPATLTQELLQAKYDTSKNRSFVNYSFFMGASNDNLEEVLKTNHQNVCGVKIFMGSSTGNMLVDKEDVLEGLFSNVDMLIATHCEDEATIRANMEKYKAKYGAKLDASFHPVIRNVDGCYISSSKAVSLAKKHNTRLHILHISTAKETELFDNTIPLASKRITAEACVHHLTFSSDDYAVKGNLIKCNPSIKTKADRDAIFTALLNDRIDIVATDHAPHTWDEKNLHYLEAPSGLPLVQHSLDMMMMHVEEGRLTLEKMVEKMCHAPAVCFQVKDRGFLREGYKADIVIYDPKSSYTVSKENIKYKCGWSPLEGKEFNGSVHSTIVNGKVVYQKGFILLQGGGERLLFDRD